MYFYKIYKTPYLDNFKLGEYLKEQRKRVLYEEDKIICKEDKVVKSKDSIYRPRHVNKKSGIYNYFKNKK